MSGCPSCGAECSPRERFCRACGAALAGAVSLSQELPMGETPKYIPVKPRLFQSRGAF